MENGILISMRGSTQKDQDRMNLNGSGGQFQILVGILFALDFCEVNANRFKSRTFHLSWKFIKNCDFRLFIRFKEDDKVTLHLFFSLNDDIFGPSNYCQNLWNRQWFVKIEWAESNKVACLFSCQIIQSFQHFLVCPQFMDQ